MTKLSKRSKRIKKSGKTIIVIQKSHLVVPTKKHRRPINRGWSRKKQARRAKPTTK